MAMMLMTFLLFGVIGANVKAVPFFAALVPAVAVTVLVAASNNDYTWYAAAGLFYGGLAVAELAYLGTLFARNAAATWWSVHRLQDRSAKIGAAE